MITNVLIFLCILSPAISVIIPPSATCSGSGITKHYVFIDEKVKSRDIDSTCASYGGIGATVPNAEINECLVTKLNKFLTQFWWIGVFRINNVWVSGEARQPVGWTLWAPNNPDAQHDFCILKKIEGNWASEPKGGMESLICEVAGPRIATVYKTSEISPNESTTGSLSQNTTLLSTNTTVSTTSVLSASQVISTTTEHSTTATLAATAYLTTPASTSPTSDITTSTSHIETAEEVYANGTTSGTSMISQTAELASSTMEQTTTTTTTKSIDSSAFANTTNHTAMATNTAPTVLSATSATTNPDTRISTETQNTEETGVTATSTIVTYSSTSIKSESTSIGISEATSTTEMAPTISTAKSDTSVMLKTEESTSSTPKQITNTPTSNTALTTFANRTVKTAIVTNTTPTTLASTTASRDSDSMVSTETSYSGERVTTGISPTVTDFTTSKKYKNTAIELVPLFPQPNKCQRHCPWYRNIEGNKITMYRINRKNTTRYRRRLNSIHYNSPTNDVIGVVFVCLVLLLYFVFILPDLKAVWMHVRHGVHPRTSQPQQKKPNTDA